MGNRRCPSLARLCLMGKGAGGYFLSEDEEDEDHEDEDDTNHNNKDGKDLNIFRCDVIYISLALGMIKHASEGPPIF